MAILLKHQLLSEMVHYTPPHIDVRKAGRDHSSVKALATRLFYDFYAMEFLHRSLGTQRPVKSDPRYLGYQDPSKATKMQKGLASVAMSNPELAAGAMFTDWDNVEFGGSNIVPHKLREVIDTVYEEVTIAISRKLLHHLRLTCIQELRHLVNYADEWNRFKMKLISIYNAKGTVSDVDFENAIRDKIPGMAHHVGTVKRLLLFTSYYKDPESPDYNPINPDILNVAKEPEKVEKPEEPKEPEIPEPDVEEPSEAPSTSEEPDDTEQGDEIEPPPFDEPSSSSSDFKQDPSYLSHDKYWDPDAKEKRKGKMYEGYASGRISPTTIRQIFAAMYKAKVTWDDIVLAYNNIDWGGGYGGSKWGSGVVAFLKLAPLAKQQDTEEMAGLIDHIFDLVHNGGNLLNKGGMFIDDKDLDRRAKVTHVARYLNDVSPLIRRIILRVLHYLSGDPNIEKDIGKIVNSPTKAFTSEEAMELAKEGLTSKGTDFVAHVPFKKKKGVDDTKTVDRYYFVKAHTNGMYSASDNLNADVQVFPSFEELLKFVKTTIASELQSSGNKPTSSMKQLYINIHTKIKLPNEQGEMLYHQAKMGWSPGIEGYKAYFPDGKRFIMFVFSDGSMMFSFKDSEEYKIIYDFHAALDYAKEITKNALANQHPDIAYPAFGKTPPAPKIATPSVSTSPIAATTATHPYLMSPFDAHSFTSYIQGQGYSTELLSDGKIAVFKPNQSFLYFSVGRRNGVYSSLPYIVYHTVGYKNNAEHWTFPTFSSLMGFVKEHLSELMLTNSIQIAASKAMMNMPVQAAPMPPNSTSKAAYTVHTGIDMPPKYSIRLTVEDEGKLESIGFTPTMVGTDVWYKHSKSGDVVKFYPNDTATLILSKKNGVKIKKTIPDMLVWLPTKYSADSQVSPLIAPSVPKAAVTPASKGISVDTSLFKNKIEGAGFVFDKTSGQYVDKNNTLFIKPNRSSVLTIPDPSGTKVYQFNNLPELVGFLKNQYDIIKEKIPSNWIPPQHPPITGTL